MTQPTPYRRGYDFADAGGALPPGGPLDGELDNLGLTVSQILRNLALLQRDDTALRNGIVGIDALDNRVLGLLSGGTFTIAGTWATATSYAAGAFFSDDEAIYLTMEAHTSVSIIDDLAAGHIVKVLQNEQGERLRDDFTGDGVTTVFTLSQSPSRPADVEVYVEGLLVPAADYAQTGATVTFDVAPTNGDKISIFSITWATTPPIQTLVDAVGDRNAEISASTQFAADLMGDEGGSKVGLAQGGFVSDAILYVTPQMFGAAGSVLVNSTAAIQAAIDSNIAEVQYPPGTYIHGNLTFNNEYQRHVGYGARFVRNANGTTITVSARGNQFYGFRFSGGSFTGNNITVSAPEVVFEKCDSIETPGRALLADSDGGNLLVNGGIWNSTDATGTGYDIELKHSGGSSSLYSRLINISTNQSTGGVLVDGQGTVRIRGCQIGKYTVSSGGGMCEGNRFNGAVSVQASSNQFTNNAFAANVTFGDGAGGNIGQIAFDSTNMMQAGTTLTINSDVVESSFHLGQIQAAGVTVVINGPNNDIWHSEISYTPVLSAGGGSPTVGDGTLTGKVSRQGRQWTANGKFTFGASSSFGTGDVAITAPFKAKTKSVGSVRITDAGVGHFTGVCEIEANAQAVSFFAGAGTTAVGTPARADVPMTWAVGDSMTFSISGEYVA